MVFSVQPFKEIIVIQYSETAFFGTVAERMRAACFPLHETGEKVG